MSSLLEGKDNRALAAASAMNAVSFATENDDEWAANLLLHKVNLPISGDFDAPPKCR